MAPASPSPSGPDVLASAWSTPEVTGVGRLPMRAPLDPHADVDQAWAGEPSPFVRSLDGTWRFRLHERPGDVDPHEPTDGPGWSDLVVPGTWVLQGGPDHPFGRPAYTNVVMPFRAEPPAVPEHNPTGVHVTTFSVPAEPMTVSTLAVTCMTRHPAGMSRIWSTSVDVGV